MILGESPVSNSFIVSEKTLIVYGAGSMGLKMINQKGIKPFAFIDKRGEEIEEFNGFIVFSVKQAFDLEEKDSYCIIIAVRDVFSHSQIALDFFNAGFKNIIFKPHAVLNGKSDSSDELLRISDAYDSLTVQNRDIIQCVPCYSGEILFNFENTSVIQDNPDEDVNSEFVKFYAPVEHLFSNDLYDDANLWTKRNFSSNYIAVDLYRALQEDDAQKNKEFERYVNLYAVPGAIRSSVNITGSWKNTVIETRLSAFNEMKKRLATDPNFFTKHCTMVSLRSPCRLQLIKSGKSRVSFLTALRMPYVPVLMQKKEYEIFLNEADSKVVYEYICKSKKATVSVPIPHPFFYTLKADISDYLYLWECKVARILYDLSFAKNRSFDTRWLRICDMSCDNGSMSRYLHNLGFNVCRKKHSDEFTLLLDDLFSIEVAQQSSEEEAQTNCYILMDLTENTDAQKLLCDIQSSTVFLFVFAESSLINSIKESLQCVFEFSKITSTLVRGKAFEGMYFRRKHDS